MIQFIIVLKDCHNITRFAVELLDTRRDPQMLLTFYIIVRPEV